MSTARFSGPRLNPPMSARWRFTAICILAISVGIAAFASAPGARAQDPTVAQCNGVDNQGGRTVHCTVEIAITGGATATVTVTACTGAGTAETCTGPTVMTQSVTAIDQCNGSGNGGGAIVKCDVIVTGAPEGADEATISQCIGSGEGGGSQPTTVCVPDSTPDDTSADVQQCNGSGNGGGGTERVKCTVTPASTTAGLPTIEQCNGFSGNGGGALVTCTVTIANGGSETGTPATGGTATTTAGGSSTPASGGTPGADSSGSGTATPATGVSAPDTGVGGDAATHGTAALFFSLGLAAMGVPAIGAAVVLRRRQALVHR